MTRTRRIACLTFGAALVVTPTISMAEFVTGNKLLEMCQIEKRVAMSYIMGAVDGTLGFADGVLCIPPTATSGQITDIACDFVRKTPKSRHGSAAALVTIAMIDANFGCPTK